MSMRVLYLMLICLIFVLLDDWICFRWLRGCAWFPDFCLQWLLICFAFRFAFFVCGVYVLFLACFVFDLCSYWCTCELVVGLLRFVCLVFSLDGYGLVYGFAFVALFRCDLLLFVVCFIALDYCWWLDYIDFRGV